MPESMSQLMRRCESSNGVQRKRGNYDETPIPRSYTLLAVSAAAAVMMPLTSVVFFVNR